MSRRKLTGQVLKVAAFLAFTAYVAVTVTTATGPAIDIAFDLAVYVALLVHLARRWLRQQPPERRH